MNSEIFKNRVIECVVNISCPFESRLYICVLVLMERDNAPFINLNDKEIMRFIDMTRVQILKAKRSLVEIGFLNYYQNNSDEVMLSTLVSSN